MPRTPAIEARTVWRGLRFRAHLALDAIDELVFHTRNRTDGLAHEDTTLSVQMLDRAIALGARFLKGQQRENGRLSGFLLQPGASTTWITAHIAFVLEDIPQVESLCRRAAGYLAAVGPNDGGWGYNRRVAPDCDSTAQALMVLNRFEVPIAPFLIRFLVESQETGGGFPTYPPPMPCRPCNGWQVAHPEVSAIVIKALSRIGGYDSAVQSGLQWVRSTLDDGILPGYWWRGKQYGLWAQARTGLLSDEAADAVGDALSMSNDVPMLPFILIAAVELNIPWDRLSAAVRKLLVEQKADGSWDCRPCLRLTSQNCYEAAAEAPGAVFADRRRVFSTAHAVAALHRIRKQIDFVANSQTARDTVQC